MTIAAPMRATTRQKRWICLYFSILLLGGGMHSPSGLFSLPILFYFKNALHLSPQRLSYFGLITAVPLYLSFLFGVVRDVWQPRRMRDRGYLLLGGLGLTGTYLAMAFIRPTWTSLLAGTLLISVGYLVISTASSALTTLIGQQRLMTGRLSGLTNIAGSVPVFISYLVGGAISDTWSLRNVFLLMAVISASLWLQAFWHSREIFSQTSLSEQEPRVRLDLRLLLRHRGALLATLIWMMWNLSPGSVTATMYYLTNTVHLTDAQYGQYQAVYTLSFCPIFACYGLLCRRYSLRSLLFWGTLAAIPQLVPILLIHSIGSAVAVAILMGIMGGVGTAAYFDLLIRACPRGLEGTVMMLAVTGYWIFVKWGDLLGSWLYDRWKYLPCVIVTTLLYASILLILPYIPRTITEDTEEAGENRRREAALDDH